MGVRPVWIVQWLSSKGEWVAMFRDVNGCKVKHVTITRADGTTQRGYLSKRSAQRALMNRKREAAADGHPFLAIRTRAVLDYQHQPSAIPSMEHAA